MRIRPLTVMLSIALSLVPFGLSLASGAGAMPSGGSMRSMQPIQQTPEEMAKSAYNSGVRSIKGAKDHEDDAAKAGNDEKKHKYLEKAQKSYSKALSEFNEAVQQQPGMYQAWNYIGFANRHLGHFDEALSAYAKALELKADYAEAIEYRGEAYLGLNQIDAAKDAYMTLFRSARPLSDQLLGAMQRWVTVRRSDAGAVNETDLDAFAKWLEDRDQIAKQTASLAIGAAPPAWP